MLPSNSTHFVHYQKQQNRIREQKKSFAKQHKWQELTNKRKKEMEAQKTYILRNDANAAPMLAQVIRAKVTTIQHYNTSRRIVEPLQQIDNLTNRAKKKIDFKKK